jgi:DNA-binding NtrC family response regulator
MEFKNFKIVIISDDEAAFSYFDFLEHKMTVSKFADSEEAFTFFNNNFETNYTEPLIHIVNNKNTKCSAREYIDFISNTKILDSVIVFDKEENSDYIKNLLKLGAVNYLELPFDLNYDKNEWEKKVSYNIEQVKAVIQNKGDIATIIKKHSEKADWEYQLWGFIDLDIKNILGHTEYTKLKEEVIGKPKSDLISTKTTQKDLEDLRKILYKALGKEAVEFPRPVVLTVDDEIDFRDFIIETLNMQNFKIFAAENGKMALDILKKENIDIILLDIMLPDIKGTDLINNIKELQPNSEIIALTAYNEIDFINKILGNGAFDYVNKPFEEEDLVGKINAAFMRIYYKKILPELIRELKTQTKEKV